MDLTVAEIYTQKVVSVNLDQSLAEVGKLFHDLAIHHLPVLDGTKLLGIISDRDYIKSVSPYVGTAAETARDAATLNKRAHQIMSRKVITIGATDLVKTAAQVMVKAGVSSLPVVSEDGEFQGILTWKDIISTLYA